jgi:hypothetical protein
MIGGFSGLGRVVLTWMVERGAWLLMLMSWSAMASPQNKTFVRDLKSQAVGVQVVALWVP